MIVAADPSLDRAAQIIQSISEQFFNFRSLLIFIISIAVALLIGRAVAFVLRRVISAIGKRADHSQNLRTVNRLRRYETFLVLSIALIRTLLLIFAFYFWWVYGHDDGARPTAVIGASALAVIIASSALAPILRDLAAGSFMMAEQWYGVGDHIRIEPFVDMQGVVERVTLRSTRLRGLNGEIIWVNNQNIQGVRLTPKGVRTVGLELFVDNLKAGEKLIEMTNKRLPIGPLLVLGPLEIISAEQVGEELWHISAVGDTAPGREWLIEESAVNLIKWLDEQSEKPVIAHGPLARYTDIDAERRFKRTINNARKRPKPRKQPVKKPTRKHKLDKK